MALLVLCLVLLDMAKGSNHGRALFVCVFLHLRHELLIWSFSLLSAFAGGERKRREEGCTGALMENTNFKSIGVGFEITLRKHKARDFMK